jgi:hypothetical protein
MDIVPEGKGKIINMIKLEETEGAVRKKRALLEGEGGTIRLFAP